MIVLFAFCVSVHIMSSKGFAGSFQREESCVSSISMEQKALENGKKGRGGGKEENILLLSDFHIFANQAKALLFSTEISLPLVYNNTFPSRAIHFHADCLQGSGSAWILHPSPQEAPQGLKIGCPDQRKESVSCKKGL